MLHLAGLMLQIWTKTIPASHPCLNLYSTHSKTGPSSNGCHKSYCYVSKYCPSKIFREKSGKKILGKCFLPSLHWWCAMQINSPRQKCHKFSNTLSVPVVCGGAVGVFVCISPVCHSSTQLCFLYSQLSEGNCCLCPMSMLGAMRWQRRYRYIGRYRYIDI